MKWLVEFHNDFYEEFKVLDIEVQDQILAKSKLLEVFGHNLGRPHVDTLTGSAFSNITEFGELHLLSIQSEKQSFW